MKDLTVGKERKLIINFALPMLVGSVFQQLYNVVDSVIVGNYLGNEALSAVGASFPIFFALISLVIGLSTGVGIVISQYFGAKKYEKVQIAVDTLFIVLFFAAIIVTVLGVYFIEDIFELIELPDNILPQAKTYLTITLLGVISAFGYNGTAAVFRSLGDSKTPLFFLILSTLTNVVLDLLFVLVLNMGIEGVAIATIISQAGAFISATIYINKKHKFLRISFLKLKFDWEIFKQGLKLGLPSGMQMMFVALGMSAIFRFVNGFGTTVIAAYSAAIRIDSFAVMPIMIFSQALTAFTGQNMGAGRIDRIMRGMKSTMIMSVVLSVSISLLIFFFGGIMISAFTPDKAVIEAGHIYLRIVCLFYVVFAVLFTFSAVFRGSGDTIVPMFITLLALWLIRIPLSWYLSKDFDEIGIWYALPLAWIFGAIASTIYYLTGNWKKKSVIKHQPVHS